MLEQVHDNLWIAEGEIVSFHGFPYPTRAVVARLENNELWVWSPVKLADELRDAVNSIGRVSHLVSPNKLHHLYLRDWLAAFPQARLWGPQSTIRKCKDLKFCAALTDTAPREWGPDFDQAWFRGSFAMDEIVFHHRPSRTAIVADLVQTFSKPFLREHWSWWQRPLANWGGISIEKACAPSDWRLTFVNRGPARAARAKVLGWQCERAIVAHGEWKRSGAGAFLARSFDWLGPVA